jgi:hypothetical protein
VSRADATTTVRLLFADEGTYREMEIAVPTEALDRYDRLIDLLQEEPAVLKNVYVDLRRLCAAEVASGRKQ